MKKTPDVFSAPASAPLSGLTIVDLTRVLSGPYCTMLAADMGARVIKIEHPQRGDDTRAWGPPFMEGESAYYLSVNRNKESVALDYTTTEGRAILDSLIERADVLVENFRAGTLEDRGLGYGALAQKHPGLIYVSISGFGHTGPRRDEAGYDAVIQAESGLMSVTGTPDGQAVRLGVAITDIAAGMFAFQGLLLALIAKGRTGRGQHVDLGLLDATTALLTYQAGRYFATGASPDRLGNQHALIAPYDTFNTADGVLVLAVGNDDQFRRFCRAAHLSHAALDSRFLTNASRVQNYATLRGLIEGALATDTATAWTTRLKEAGVPCGAVRSVGDALRDPQILARAMIESVAHPTIGPLQVLGVPVKLSDTPGSVRCPPPRLGEHTASVLRDDLGYEDARIATLAESGAVRVIPPDQRDVERT
ncbi:MAG: CoA transferase [Vicinamibacterales bacterium]